jgi:IS30 family transposase
MGSDQDCPDDCPLAVWASLSPRDRKSQRKAIAEKLYKLNYTMEEIAKQLGVTHKTISQDLKGFVPKVQTPRPKGGRPKGASPKKPSRPRKTKAEQIREYNEATGFEITKVNVRRLKPVGKMPEDIRERFEKEFHDVSMTMENLYQLGRYSDQMSEEMRHFIARILKQVRARFEEMAKEMLGGDGDLRKIKKQICGEDIPIRGSTTLQ